MSQSNESLNDRPRLKIVGTQDKTEIGGFSVVGDGLNPCVAYFAYSDDAQFFCDIWNMGEPRGRLSASVQTENVGSNPTSPANTSEIPLPIYCGFCKGVGGRHYRDCGVDPLNKPVLGKQGAAVALSKAILEAHARWAEEYQGVSHE